MENKELIIRGVQWSPMTRKCSIASLQQPHLSLITSMYSSVHYQLIQHYQQEVSKVTFQHIVQSPFQCTTKFWSLDLPMISSYYSKCTALFVKESFTSMAKKVPRGGCTEASGKYQNIVSLVGPVCDMFREP
jgi:hypothetical protein